jgi:hypothetical protein
MFSRGFDHTAEDTVAVVANKFDQHLWRRVQTDGRLLVSSSRQSPSLEKAKMFGTRIDIRVDPEKAKRSQIER